MKYTALVMKTAMKNNFRLRAVAIVLTGIVFICVVGLAVLFGTQFIRPEVNAAAPSRSVLENFLGLILFITSFISIGIYASVFAFQSMTREKARGNIQALLATPINPDNIWLGKSLGVFLPGLAFAVVMTLAALLAINYIYFVPRMGFIVTPWMIVSSFIAVPLVYLALSLLVHLVGLTGKPATGNVIAQIFLPVMIALMINLAVRNMPNVGSWLFAVILLSVAAVIGVIVLAIRPTLTIEKVILSS
jgi:ABC-type transport system involved in multi-copper enzyme maturation permease subunit